MRILLTNDDGFESEGIKALYDCISPKAHTQISAPFTEKSGMGHSITIFHPIRVKTIKRHGELIGYAVDGTPADCVKIGAQELMKPKPNLVISGINPAANIGTNILYSGTVSAALEAYITGIPAIAVSIDGTMSPELNYEFAAQTAWKAAAELEKMGLPLCVMNINIPNIPVNKIKGVKATRQGNSRFIEHFKKNTDPRNNAYYWLDGEQFYGKPKRDTDDYAILNSYISVTPLGISLNDDKFFAAAQKIARQL